MCVQLQTMGSRSMSYSNYDMWIISDFLPEQPPPKPEWKFSDCLAKIMLILNHCIILSVVIANYFPAGNVRGLSYGLNLHEYNAVVSEVIKLRRDLIQLQKIQDNYRSINDGVLNMLYDVDSKIRSAIELYDADKIGIIDYALETSGAFITSTPETRPCKSKATYKVFQFFDYEPTSNPRTIIQKGITPGQCFAFEGSRGRFRIKLSKDIVIGCVTLEHAHRSLLMDLRSTPKDFEIYGLLGEDDPRGFKLGTFQYDLNGNQLQTFQITNGTTKRYTFVELRILNNYDHPDYTCVYRFRVHSK